MHIIKIVNQVLITQENLILLKLIIKKHIVPIMITYVIHYLNKRKNIKITKL